MSLQLPTILHGRYRDVRPRLMRVVKRMKRGQEWIPVAEQGGFVDVATTPGHIVGYGPSPLLGAQEHFQMWLLWALAYPKTERDIRDTIFRESLTRSWTVLGLVMSYNHHWMWHESRHAPFLRAVHHYWDDFVAEGARYTLGSGPGKELWQVHNSAVYVLANQGVRTDFMSAAELAELMRSCGIDTPAEP